MNTKPLTYLACPYSHPDFEVRQARFEAVNRAAGKLIEEQNLVLFSPISHTHPIAVRSGMVLGWEYWEAFDRAYLSCSKKLIVLMLDGWQESVGVTAEIKIAQEEVGIPVEYLEPSDADKVFTSLSRPVAQNSGTRHLFSDEVVQFCKRQGYSRTGQVTPKEFSEIAFRLFGVFSLSSLSLDQVVTISSCTAFARLHTAESHGQTGA